MIRFLICAKTGKGGGGNDSCRSDSRSKPHLGRRRRRRRRLKRSSLVQVHCSKTLLEVPASVAIKTAELGGGAQGGEINKPKKKKKRKIINFEKAKSKTRKSAAVRSVPHAGVGGGLAASHCRRWLIDHQREHIYTRTHTGPLKLRDAQRFLFFLNHCPFRVS